ncbi:DNA cytosine methyltransferase [Hoylesella nanceiensis]|uniref:DNA cytosine methyltransferase n=1 Tax=Hoylesella nanceiensis TaxID=425941 RepID=UPI001CB432EF|nr:DNA (cytosine-5-)-methyltransferase [Hoylesella nanceiensis]MBF1429217.1 DNA (cytosine-5-)-methyltransferase [Hoylesella nanceiensis]
MEHFFTITNVSDILSVSIRTVNTWINKGTLILEKNKKGQTGFYAHQLLGIPQIEAMINSNWESEYNIKPVRDFTSIELFAGGGGLALGMEKAGFKHILLNEFDKSACDTLRKNRPNWNVVEGDIHKVSFKDYEGKVDFLSGGFPCQAFSYAGKKAGFEDARGTLFFELARAVKEVKPKVFMGENVKGLYTHEKGHTFEVIKSVIEDLGYTLVEPQILKAIQYQVPQKRERLILIAIRNDIANKVTFHYPAPYHRVLTLRDAFFKGILYNCDVPESIGQQYPNRKKEIMEKVPMGGYWKDLPDELQREYMKGSYYMGGGKTGIARRLSLDEPSLTLTCAPAMKQTERCHPIETRPLTVREYARIQTFPDNWEFCGNMIAQYKQIGNAVPVNLAAAVGRSIIRLFNDIETI